MDIKYYIIVWFPWLRVWLSHQKFLDDIQGLTLQKIGTWNVKMKLLNTPSNTLFLKINCISSVMFETHIQYHMKIC